MKIKKLDTLNKNKVLLLSTQCGDWVGLYINGELIEEGHQIQRDEWLKYAHTFNFNHKGLKSVELDDEDERKAMQTGGFPKNAFDKYY